MSTKKEKIEPLSFKTSDALISFIHSAAGRFPLCANGRHGFSGDPRRRLRWQVPASRFLISRILSGDQFVDQPQFGRWENRLGGSQLGA